MIPTERVVRRPRARGFSTKDELLLLELEDAAGKRDELDGPSRLLGSRLRGTADSLGLGRGTADSLGLGLGLSSMDTTDGVLAGDRDPDVTSCNSGEKSWLLLLILLLLALLLLVLEMGNSLVTTLDEARELVVVEVRLRSELFEGRSGFADSD